MLKIGLKINKRKYDYYNGFEGFISIGDYSNWIHKLNNKCQVNITSKPFFLRNKLSNKTERNEISRNFGKPKRLNILNFNNQKLRQLLYKIYIGPHKVRLQMHILDDMLMIHSYTFPYLNFEEKKEILKKLRLKYQINEDIDFDKSIFVTENNSAIYVSEECMLSIFYVHDMQSDFIQKLLANRVSSEKTKKHKLQKDLIMKL